MQDRYSWVRSTSAVTLLSSFALTACTHVGTTSENKVSPRTFAEFELIEARENRERLRTLNQLKTKRSSAD